MATRMWAALLLLTAALALGGRAQEGEGEEKAPIYCGDKNCYDVLGCG